MISFYSPGQCIKIGESTGEILSITPLYLKLLGRNLNGEHTGELLHIANHQIRQHKIALIDLDLNTVQKVLMEIPYNYDDYCLSFDDFVHQFQEFLNETFPINSLKFAEHYKSFKGYKYKLNYDIDSEGRSIVRL